MLINGKSWEIVPLKAYDDRLKRSDNVHVLGACNNKAKEVYISKNITGNLKQKVLTHEVCHCFCFEYKLNLDIQTEEIICDFMATYGRDVIGIVDNILKNVRRYA